jgi:acetate kinase
VPSGCSTWTRPIIAAPPSRASSWARAAATSTRRSRSTCSASPASRRRPSTKPSTLGSGLRALGGTNDVRELLAREQAGDERARLALEIYCYRIKKYLGAYCAVLGRVDAVVFTGGVGENAARVRSLACAGLDRLGIVLDEQANGASAGDLCEIGKGGSAVRVLVVRTNEELEIAREALAALGAA